jgi:hypothetical protein
MTRTGLGGAHHDQIESLERLRVGVQESNEHSRPEMAAQPRALVLVQIDRLLEWARHHRDRTDEAEGSIERATRR